ncbi:hypothetical protein [Capnocytophaga sp. oral taxon 324]|uniref:hypothetical protein n=1 Tax=Capnocytophaga sp. oral taxon 324 TaxID=712211 RepID=UPI0002A1D344|nr:hypothetical protein [Capnocytophaga sp. oral taxon 324]EKY18018.1 hypothetical protein HMPREF9072_00104 [Capnocytophaga sp. oral taxon 324 str. F0483]
MKLCFAILSLFTSLAYAQYTLPSQDIALIVYNKDSDITVYKQTQNGKYVEASLQKHYDKTYQGYYRPFTLSWKYDTKEKTLSELLEKGDKLIYPRDIRPTEWANFINHPLVTSHLLSFSEDNGKYKKRAKTIVKFLNPSLATVQLLQYKKADSEDVGGYFYTEETKIKKWRPYEVRYSPLMALDFGEGRKVYLLEESDMIVPLQHKTLFISNEYSVCTSLKAENGKSIDTSYLTDFYDLSDYYDYHKINEFLYLLPKGDKYELKNRYLQNVLPKSYDTILFNRWAIIGKEGTQIDIYNALFEKQPLTGVLSAYLTDNGSIEMLTDKGVSYYNIQQTKKNLRQMIFRQGNDVYRSPKLGYHIEKDSLTYEYYVSYISDNYDLKLHGRNYYLTDRLAEEHLSFIGERKYFYDSHTQKLIATQIPICVERGDKYGLYLYTFSNVFAGEYEKILFSLYEYEFEPPDKLKMFDPQYLTGKEVLPIAFDTIEISKDDKRIIFSKDGKIGIYPQVTAEYELLEKISSSFYKIIKNGRKGYLDFHLLREYL